MLFFAAAILFSSVNVLGVTGPVAVPLHEATPVVVSSTDAASPSVLLAADSVLRVPSGAALGESEPDLAACGADESGRATSATTSGDLTPLACLDALAAASPASLARFDESLDVASGADLTLAQELGDTVAGARVVSAWWSAVPEAQRGVLIESVPNLVGNLEGVPYAERDLANRVTLRTTISGLEDGAQAGTASAATARLAMLEQVRSALVAGSDGNDTERGLVSLDTVFPGRAAIAVGDLDTAQNVSVMVPGMLYTVSTQMVSFTDAAAAIQSGQTFWSNALATEASAPESSAVVAWMGYRTPGVTNVLGLSLAQAGAVHLENTVEGLDAVRTGDRPRTTIIAHSYGSTTATIALSSKTIHVDDFVALGSPGSVVPDAADLAVDSGHVYAAAAALDPVAGSTVFGADPGSVQFGAKLLNLGAMVDPYTSQRVTAVVTHNQYFTTGSHAMRSLALIGIGRGDLADGRPPVPDAPEQLASPNLALVRPQDVVRESLQQA